MFKVSIVAALFAMLVACGGKDGAGESKAPSDRAENRIDSDGDGIQDHLDAFEHDSAASIDDDNDGLPDKWNDGCDASCQMKSDLMLDEHLNDSDNDGVINEEDAFPLNELEQTDTDKDGIGDNTDAFKNNAAASVDADSDGLPDTWNESCSLDCQNNSGLKLDQSLNDSDNDGVINEEDAFPLNELEQADTDKDGIGDNTDAFKNNAAASVDADSDGLPDTWNESCYLGCQNNSGLKLDQSLNDSDNDGVKNENDAFPFDETEHRDTDGDGVGDNTDAFKNNAAASVDADSDGLPDQWNVECDTNCQTESSLILDQFLNDSDNDGVINEEDAFPFNELEQTDTDKDGIGDNTDAFKNNAAASVDADLDGLPDQWNADCDNDCQKDSSLTLDEHLNDTDNDGVKNENDAFPFDETEHLDTDGDGVGDNKDVFKNNAAASVDADSDGLPDTWNESCSLGCQNNSGLKLDQSLNDSDNDGVINEEDAFPLNELEQADTDKDGIGDNTDAFKNNAAASVDADSDGLPDQWNADCDTDCQKDSSLTLDEHLNDTDNDGVINEEDAFPLNELEQADTDKDGIGDNADAFKDNAAASVDADTDGLPDAWNETCSIECQNDSGLTLDQLLDDSDNDGVKNENDAFPFDETEHLDTDEDGIGNKADLDDDGDDIQDHMDPKPLDSLNVNISLDEISDGVRATKHQLFQLGAKTGSFVSGIGDINNDGKDDFAISAVRASYVEEDRHPVYVIFGGTRPSINSQDIRYPSVNHSIMIKSLQALDGTDSYYKTANIGDINGDQIDDLVVIGGKHISGGTTMAGIAYVFFGKENGESWNKSLTFVDADVTLNFGYAYAGKELSISGIGDFNNDGIHDFVVGLHGQSSSGNAYLILGRETWSQEIDIVEGFESTLDGSNGMAITAKGHIYEGSNGRVIDAGGKFGYSVAGAGDINNDGYADVIIGAPDMDYFDKKTGGTYVIFGRKTLPASFEVSQVDGKNGIFIDPISVAGYYDQLGKSVSGVGDIDDDGIDDVVLGSDRTETILLFGKESWDAKHNARTNSLRINATVDSLINLGDFNNDGIDDLMLGRLGAPSSYNIMFGSQNFTTIWRYDYALKILNPGYGKFDGIKGVSIDVSGSPGGYSILAVAGDVDGDGKLDLIAGDSRHGEQNQGISQLLYGYYP